MPIFSWTHAPNAPNFWDRILHLVLFKCHFHKKLARGQDHLRIYVSTPTTHDLTEKTYKWSLPHRRIWQIYLNRRRLLYIRLVISSRIKRTADSLLHLSPKLLCSLGQPIWPSSQTGFCKLVLIDGSSFNSSYKRP